MNWSNITLFKFQEVERINSDTKMDDLDKLLFTTCIVFDLTEYQLDQMDPKKAAKLMGKVGKVFAGEFKPVPQKRIGWYEVEYDVAKICLGQYVELSHFLQGNVIQNAHYILASITNLPLMKNDAAKHMAKADYFLHQPITKTLGSVSHFIERFAEFNNGYKTLFGLDKEHVESEGDPFNKRFGWQFSAREIAKDEGITLDQAYNLPIRQALNSLSYLKAKTQYEERQLKQSGNGR